MKKLIVDELNDLGKVGLPVDLFSFKPIKLVLGGTGGCLNDAEKLLVFLELKS